MKIKKQSKKTIYRPINIVFTTAIIVSLLLNSKGIHSFVPDYAEVMEIKGSKAIFKSTDGGEKEDAQVKDKLEKVRSVLTVRAPYGSENIYAKLDLIQRGRDKKKSSLKAIAHNNHTTRYMIPCTVYHENSTEAEFTWDAGKGSSCGEKTLFTTNKQRIGDSANNQHIQIAQTKSLDIAQNLPRWNYYCNSVPNDYRGPSGNFAVETTSIEKACVQSQQKCQTSQRQDCSIATMGRWNLDDSELRTSFICYDGNNNEDWKLLDGKSIKDLLIIKEKLEPFQNRSSCYLEVYHSDEILISPDDNRLTRVKTYGLNGGIRVDVLEGSVTLRSTKAPGIKASKNQIYFFNGSGSLFPFGRDNKVPQIRVIPPIAPIPPIPPIPPSSF